MAVLLWLLVVSYISTSAASDSILDIINTQEVERLIAERRGNASKDLNLDQNLLDNDEEDPENNLELPPLRKNLTAELQELSSRHGEKLLRSSKNALLVTKKDYLRKDWCKTEPLVQVIREEGCTPVSVVNRFCYGQCNSFYIPKNPKRKVKAGKVDMELSAFKSCAFCRPKYSSWITVTLRCHKKKRVSIRRKRVLRVKQCKCIAENVN